MVTVDRSRALIFKVAIALAIALFRGDGASVSKTESGVLDEIRKGAEALESLVESEGGKEFLAAAEGLPRVETRVIYRNRERNLALTESDF